MGLKNEFKIAMVNEPSVFKPLKIYCVSALCSNQSPKVLCTAKCTIVRGCKAEGERALGCLAEHKNFPAHECYNAINWWHFNIYEQEKHHSRPEYLSLRSAEFLAMSILMSM